jgi:hypothetical protein
MSARIAGLPALSQAIHRERFPDDPALSIFTLARCCISI